MPDSLQLKETKLNGFLLILIVTVLVIQLHLQFVQKINWDEFYFLSLVYDHQRGDLAKPLQTAHVHFFGWLKYISPNEVSQIIAARFVMWVFQLGTLYFIYKTSREFISRDAALFAVLSFLGFGFIFIHGTSFRADPMAAFFMTAAVYIFTATDLKLKYLIALTISLVLGFLITVKVIFFAPLFLSLAFWRLTKTESIKELFIKFSLTVVAVITLIGFGYLFQLSQMVEANLSGSKDMLGNAGRTTLFSGGVFPRGRIIQQHFIFGLISSFMMCIGFVFILLDFVNKPFERARLLILLAMGLPVLSLVFYRNAFPYFFAFIFPSVIIWAGYGAERLKKMPLLIGILALATTAFMGVQYKYRLKENKTVQYETLEELHRIFPEPVNYIDRSSMMASASKSGFFMSSWGLTNYKNKNQPVLELAMRRDVIPVVIDNSPEINWALIIGDIESQLLQKDQAALRDNYIHYWGHIWIAGKELNLSSKETSFNNLVPGTYRLESDYPITMNGHRYDGGELVTLPRGTYHITSKDPQDISLRWGENITPPERPEPLRPIFTNF